MIDHPTALLSIPKSGTHLLERALFKLGSKRAEAAIWSMRELPIEELGPGEEAITGIGGEGRRFPVGQVCRYLDTVEAGQHTIGHAGYSETFEEILRERGFRIIFLYRDPRDCVCSHADWLIDPKAPDVRRREHFSDMPFGDRLMRLIEGGPLEEGVRTPPLPQQHASRLRWRDCEQVLSIRYEDLVGEQGGGSAAAQRGALERIARHIGLDPDDADLGRVANDLYGNVRTFRHGRIGRWRECFEARHLKAAEPLADLLIDLGYENDRAWLESPLSDIPFEGAAPRPRAGAAKREDWHPRRYWNDYVERFFRPGGAGEAHLWPGDERRSPREANARFDDLVPLPEARGWQKVVELGPGSGRFTRRLLDLSPQVKVRTYEAADRYLALQRDRFRPEVEAGRLTLNPVAAVRPDEILLDLDEADWRGDLDAVLSFEALLHVDLEFAAPLLLTAALALKPGGLLALSLADATSDEGFAKLLDDLAPTFPHQGRPNGRYEWTDPYSARHMLERFGFHIERMVRGREMHIVARLHAPDRSMQLKQYLQPVSGR